MNDDKRGYHRGYSLLYITLSDGKKFTKEFVYNASPGGLMIKCSETWEIGTLLDIIVHSHIPIRTKGRVAWIKQDGQIYMIGIEFEDLNTGTVTWWDHILKEILE